MTSGVIRQKAAHAAFGRRFTTNKWRDLVAEIIIGAALGSQWHWRPEDWVDWDFEHIDGTMLAVRQYAACSDWQQPGSKASRCTFDIAPSAGYWQAGCWIARRHRPAHIYVFAYHPRTDEAADHCDPTQWEFYVVPTAILPPDDEIDLARVRDLSSHFIFAEIDMFIEQFNKAIYRPYC
jgi:hypothetical protein